MPNLENLKKKYACAVVARQCTYARMLKVFWVGNAIYVIFLFAEFRVSQAKVAFSHLQWVRSLLVYYLSAP